MSEWGRGGGRVMHQNHFMNIKPIGPNPCVLTIPLSSNTEIPSCSTLFHALCSSFINLSPIAFVLASSFFWPPYKLSPVYCAQHTQSFCLRFCLFMSLYDHSVVTVSMRPLRHTTLFSPYLFAPRLFISSALIECTSPHHNPPPPSPNPQYNERGKVSYNLMLLVFIMFLRWLISFTFVIF